MEETADGSAVVLTYTSQDGEEVGKSFTQQTHQPVAFCSGKITFWNGTSKQSILAARKHHRLELH